MEVCSNAEVGSDCGEAGRCYVHGGLTCRCLQGTTFNATSGKCIGKLLQWGLLIS